MQVKRFIEGPVMTNMYVVSDENKEGFIVDCAYPSRAVEEYIEKNNIKIKFILQTFSFSTTTLALLTFCIIALINSLSYIHSPQF